MEEESAREISNLDFKFIFSLHNLVKSVYQFLRLEEKI